MMEFALKNTVVVLILSGLALMVVGFVMMLMEPNENEYLWAPGNILSSEIIKVPNSSGDGSSWALNVSYEYRVDEVTFRGDVVSTQVLFSPATDGQEPSKELKKLEKRYADNNLVLVHYNPEDPTEAVLIKHDRELPVIFWVGLGVFFLGLIVAFGSDLLPELTWLFFWMALGN